MGNSLHHGIVVGCYFQLVQKIIEEKDKQEMKLKTCSWRQKRCGISALWCQTVPHSMVQILAFLEWCQNCKNTNFLPFQHLNCKFNYLFETNWPQRHGCDGFASENRRSISIKYSIDVRLQVLVSDQWNKGFKTLRVSPSIQTQIQ